MRRVAIIGAGPAGLALAIYLKQLNAQLDVTVFDAKSEMQDKIAVSIPPHILPYLKRIFAEQYESVLAAHQPSVGSASVWNNSDPAFNDFLLNAEGDGYHLQRPLFELQLAHRAKRLGVTLCYQHKLVAVSQQAPWCLSLSHQGKTLEYAADFIVDASGQTGHLTNQLGVVRNDVDKLYFISTFVDLSDAEEELNHSCIEAVKEGWWYAAPQSNGSLMLSFATDAFNYRKFNLTNPAIFLRLFKRTVWLQHKLPQALVAPENMRVDLARTSMLSTVRGNAWLAIGDAASSYDPISSAGVGKAFIQAELAAKAIIDALEHSDTQGLDEYQQQVRTDFMQFIDMRNSHYQCQRFANTGFWQRRFS